MRPPVNTTPIVMRWGRNVTTRAQGGYDTGRRAPRATRDESGVEVSFRAQWVESSRARQRDGHSGDEPTSVCYFDIRPGDLARLEAAAGVSLAKGDCVISKNGVLIRPRLYVVEIRDTAHQQVADGVTLKQVFLSDRSPLSG